MAAAMPSADEILRQIAEIVGGVAAPSEAGAQAAAAAPAPAAAPSRLAPGTDFLRELFQRTHGGLLPDEYGARVQAGTAPTPTRIGPKRMQRLFADRLREYIAQGAPPISEEFAWNVRNRDPATLAFIERLRGGG